ncbi:dynein regulatory complex protein 8 isoform X3 [Sorex araneus]|uniref:dynein regulatory complex protein 8 isoform X3 n=1 Tax=Sorex araneus TaxID=42254 RepID=UPI0024335FAD|nr:dynein regulatory complex protein 8 isoform X3 [Sorex araneus]
MAAEKETDVPDTVLAEYQKKVKEAFEVFDHEENGTVDVSFQAVEQSSWYSSLLFLGVEEEEPTGYIRYEKFLPVMIKVLQEKRYRPIPEDVLLQAFEVLDPEKRGYLSKDELIKYMTEEGEPFSQEEMEEMLSAAIDPVANVIYYKDYVTMMVLDES